MADFQTTATSHHAHDCPEAWKDSYSKTLRDRLEESITGMTFLTSTMLGLKTALDILQNGSQSGLQSRSDLASMFSQIDNATGAQIDRVVQNLTESKASFTHAGPRMRRQLSAGTSECQTGCPYSEAVPVPFGETETLTGYVLCAASETF